MSWRQFQELQYVYHVVCHVSAARTTRAHVALSWPEETFFPPVLSNSALTLLSTKDGITEKKNLSHFQTSCFIGLCGRTRYFNYIKIIEFAWSQTSLKYLCLVWCLSVYLCGRRQRGRVRANKLSFNIYFIYFKLHRFPRSLTSGGLKT